MLFIELFLIVLILVLTAFYFKENLSNLGNPIQKEKPIDKYSIVVEPTQDDPFMNNENDVLKVLPKFDDSTLLKIKEYSSRAYKEASEISNFADRTFITYPEDDQQAFMDYLGYGSYSEPGLRYEDLRSKRR